MQAPMQYSLPEAGDPRGGFFPFMRSARLLLVLAGLVLPANAPAQLHGVQLSKLAVTGETAPDTRCS